MIEEIYRPITRAIEKLASGHSHLAFVRGPGGTGKCVVGSTKILTPSGDSVQIKDKPTDVLTLDLSSLKLIPAKVKEYYEREVNRTLLITTRTGREIELTEEHPLLMWEGWKEAKHVKVKDMIAVPRNYEFSNKDKYKDHEVKLLAYLIAEGGLTVSTPSFSKMNQEVLEDFSNYLKLFNKELVLVKRKEGHYGITDPNKIGRTNSLNKFLRENQLHGKHSRDKEIPKNIMCTSLRQVRLFLETLFECDGCVEREAITYSSASKELLKGIQNLLLRMNILSVYREKIVKGATYYVMSITDNASIQTFYNNMRLISKQQKLKRLYEVKKHLHPNSNIDLFPLMLFERIERGRKYYKKHHNIYVEKQYRPSRNKLKEIFLTGEEDWLRRHIDSDILWDEIKSITINKGKQKVYDIEIAHPSHNFVANDIIIHNSHTITTHLKELEVDFKRISGDVTEAFLYRLFYEYNGKVIYFNDTSRLLKGLRSVNLLKHATELEDKRILTRNNYSVHEIDLPDSFEFTGKLIFDYNELPKNTLRGDFEALISRGDFIDFNLSKEQTAEVMRVIATEPWQKEVTEYLIKTHTFTGRNKLNLRTQYKAFRTYEYAIDKGLDWKKEIEYELHNATSDIRTILFNLIGDEPVSVVTLKKLLVTSGVVNSLRTADRRVKEWLTLEELHAHSIVTRNPIVSIHERED